MSDFPPHSWLKGFVIRVQSACYSCRRKEQRSRRKRLTSDQRQANREYDREHSVARARARGVQPRKVGPKNRGKYGGGRTKGPSVRPEHKQDYVPTQIARSFLNVIQRRAAAYDSNSRDGLGVVATWTGVNEKVLRRIQNEEYPRVEVDTVEKIIEHSDYTMVDVQEAIIEWAVLTGADWP